MPYSGIQSNTLHPGSLIQALPEILCTFTLTAKLRQRSKLGNCSRFSMTAHVVAPIALKDFHNAPCRFTVP